MASSEHTLPVLHIPRLLSRERSDTPGLLVEDLEALLDRLDERGGQTPAITGLIRGHLSIRSLETPFLLTTSETRPRQLAWWARLLSERGYSSVLFCTPEAFTDEHPLAETSGPLLAGHGIALASRGLHEEPLVGRDVGELRHELRESRTRLSTLAGYPVPLLAPVSTATGEAVDGLVEREARRASYPILFEPGRQFPTLDPAEPNAVLPYLTCYASDSIDSLVRWITGDVVGRLNTRVRRLVDAPRRFLSDLVRPDRS